MQASYKDGSHESWDGLTEARARALTADRAMNPDVEYVEMRNGDIKEFPARNRHQRRRDKKLGRKERK